MSSSVEPRPNGLNGLKRKTYETLDYRSLVYAKNQLDSLWKRVRDGNPNDTIILQAAHNASKSGYFHITFTTYMYHCDEKTLKVESFRKCFFTAKGFALKLTDECDLNVLPDYGPPKDIDYIMWFRQFMRLPESASRFGKFCPGMGWPTTREAFERALQAYTNPKREGMHFHSYQWLPKKPGIYCYEPQPIKSAI